MDDKPDMKTTTFNVRRVSKEDIQKKQMQVRIGRINEELLKLSSISELLADCEKLRECDPKALSLLLKGFTDQISDEVTILDELIGF